MRIGRITTSDGPRYVVDHAGEWVETPDPFVDHPEWVASHGDDVELIAPVDPRIVLGMMHNTAPDDRALAPQAFSKSPRGVIGSGEPIMIDPRLGAVKGEGELVIVIGRTCRNIIADDFDKVVAGWTCGNDVTAVDQAAKDSLMLQVKWGDGFTPLGPWVETELDLDATRVHCGVAGGPEFEAGPEGLAWSPVEVLVHLSRYMTLGPGDVILAGAPYTSFDIVAGDSCHVQIDGIGSIENPVVELPGVEDQPLD